MMATHKWGEKNRVESYSNKQSSDRGDKYSTRLTADDNQLRHSFPLKSSIHKLKPKGSWFKGFAGCFKPKRAILFCLG